MRRALSVPAVMFLLFLLILPVVQSTPHFKLQWDYQTYNEVWKVKISEDGNRIVAADHSRVYFFSREKPRPKWSIELVERMGSLSITPDAKYIAACAFDKIYLIDNEGNKLWERYLLERGQVGELIGVSVNDVVISSDGDYVVAVGTYSVNLFSRLGVRLWYEYGNPDGPATVRRVTISEDGKKIAAGDVDGVVSIFSVEDGFLKAVKVSDSQVEEVEIDKDGKLVFVATFDKVAILDEGLNVLDSYSLDSCLDLDITPDGTRLVVGTATDVYLFSTIDGQLRLLWQRPIPITSEVAISNDGRYIAVAAGDVIVFDNNGNKIGDYRTDALCVDVEREPYIVAGTYTKKVLLFGVNSPPHLTGASLFPTIGDVTTEFVYRITYADNDGDPPSYVKVFIDDVPHEMVKVEGDFLTGATFEYRGRLSAGIHSYYFEAADSHGAIARYPQDGAFPGPTVSGLGDREEEPPERIPFPIIIGIVIGVLLVVVAVILKFIATKTY